MMADQEPTSVIIDTDGRVKVEATGEVVTCSWFALCERDATDVLDHPVLGGVPICTPCLDRVTGP